MVPTHNGSTYNGLTSDGLVPQYQMIARAAGCYQNSEQEGKDKVACPACRSVFLLSSHWVRRFFINLNLSVFSFVSKSFFIDWFFVRFFSSVSLIGLGGFSSVTWSSFEMHQLSYGARMFSLVSQFSSPISQWVGRFFTRLHSSLHLYVWRSSRLKGKVIVMSQSRDLQITGCTSSSLPPLWALFCTASLSLQPYHHTYGTSPPDYLETRVTMMLVDQTNEARRSNVGQDFGGVQFMSMITT